MAKMNLVLGRYNFSRAVDGIFSAPVSLSVGRIIVKVTYYHAGTGSLYSSLRIMGVKMGDTPEKLGDESSTDATATPIPVDVPITGDPIIRGAYQYYILVTLNSFSFFEKVKIVYRE